MKSQRAPKLGRNGKFLFFCGTCQWCDSEIWRTLANKHHVYKFCSLKCVNGPRRRSPNPHEAKLFRETFLKGFGCRRLAKQFNLCKTTTLRWIRQLRLDRKWRAIAPFDNVTNRLPLEKWAERILWEQFRSERGKLARFDEQHHWSAHPEVNRWRARVSGNQRYRADPKAWNQRTKSYRQTPNGRALRNAIMKRGRAKLKPWYVRFQLQSGTGLSAKDFPPNLVELQRKKMELKRLLKQKTQV